ncbi:hypothetical protein DFJ43DRAFT_1101453 [Lentinula guzmanii]|uniref:Homeobox domain-containing protein n=1 Tax=Lentinula guzmanii TaxID=2804957 RepID=A0AA38J9P2_9AGAR|nr:hypothetical protein DFJ43DRAFT_1101453 [Lentinula guzmanii]
MDVHLQTKESFSQIKSSHDTIKRLPPEGVQVLREVFENGLTHPKKQERQFLLKRIHALGITWYNDEKMKAWFVHNRKKQGVSAATTTFPEDRLKLTLKIPSLKPDTAAAAAEPSSALSIDTPQNSSGTAYYKHRHGKARLTQYPSIKLSAVPQLQILADSTQNPSAKVVETWAELLKASPHDVDRWVKDYKSKSVPGAGDTAATALSGSSEPARASEQPNDSDSEDELLMMGSSLSQSRAEEMQSETALPGRPLPQILPRDQLLLAINNATSDTSDHVSSPETASQFASLFTPYGTMMERLVQDIKTGKLESEGWNFNPNTVQT